MPNPVPPEFAVLIAAQRAWFDKLISQDVEGYEMATFLMNAATQLAQRIINDRTVPVDHSLYARAQRVLSEFEAFRREAVS